jgi:4-oxalocrotonate tautomerase
MKHRWGRFALRPPAHDREDRDIWVPALAEPVIGPRFARTRWLGRDDSGARTANKETAMPEVYVHAVEGRSPEQKKALMKDITEAVMKHFNAPAEAVVVTVVEAARTDKMKGGKLFSER